MNVFDCSRCGQPYDSGAAGIWFDHPNSDKFADTYRLCLMCSAMVMDLILNEREFKEREEA